MRLLVSGATGVAGLNIYRAALNDPSVSTITLLLRREMPSWAVLPSNAAEKTTTMIHNDFTTYTQDDVARLAQHDACIWALGIASRGLSESDYTRITYDYPMAAIRALRDAGVGENRPADKPFRFVYVSGELADATETSSQMWARVKGRAENDLTSFCDSTTGMKVHVLRPAYFFPSKEYPSERLNQRTAFNDYMDRYFLVPVVSRLFPAYYSPIDQWPRVALEVAKGRWPDQSLFRNELMRELGKEL